jgi:inorganic pyrophosphatase
MPGKKSEESFWKAVDSLVLESEIVIDRPKGSHHPRYPEIVYPVDYGYLKNTTSMDGSGSDRLYRRPA